MLKTVFVVCLVFYFIIYFYLAIKTGKPFKTVFLSALFGVLAIAAINLSSKYTGTYIPVNPVSVGTGSILGVSGVIGLLLLKMIFI